MSLASDTPRGEPARRQPFRRFFGSLGPGLITGAADDDPSGISTYSVTGASFGYAPLWTALFSFPRARRRLRGVQRSVDAVLVGGGERRPRAAADRARDAAHERRERHGDADQF